MIKGIGWGMYLFFAIWLFIGAVFVWFFVPETKNKTLEEMDLVFGSVMGAHDLELFRAAREEVGLESVLHGDGSAEKAADEKLKDSGQVEAV